MKATDLMRDAEIRALELVGREMPDVLHRIVRAAVVVSGAPSAELNVLTGSAQETLVNHVGQATRSPLGSSICLRIIGEEPAAQMIEDAAADPRFLDNGAVTSGMVRGYAAAKLVTATGVPIGTLCVYDSEPRVLDEQQMASLAELAAAVVDVLEARRQDADLREAVSGLALSHQELRRSNEHLAAFAGQVAHDLQGPLAAVLMGLQLLGEVGSLGDEQQALLDRTLSGGLRMQRAIAGLMEFAAVGSRLERVDLDLPAITQQVVEDLAARAGRCRVEVRRLPEAVGNDVQIRAVLQNLVANAMKYAATAEEPVIRVSGVVRDGRSRIEVSDNGPGVPPDLREAIFQPGDRGEHEADRSISGLGIGLATCRRIVDAHGGTIGVEESPTGGATFWFELPLPVEAEVAASA